VPYAPAPVAFTPEPERTPIVTVLNAPATAFIVVPLVAVFSWFSARPSPISGAIAAV
jgi:hypothetical protein